MNKKIEAIVVETPYFVGGNSIRFLISLMGVLVLMVGGLMMLSIVLILPGMFIILTGAGMAILGAPKAKIECPACDTENKITIMTKRLDCEGCGQKFPIKWVDPDFKGSSFASLFKKKRK